MRELEKMRQQSIENGTFFPNAVSSSDKLSYSQTINLNNLKSLENLNS